MVFERFCGVAFQKNFFYVVSVIILVDCLVYNGFEGIPAILMLKFFQ